MWQITHQIRFQSRTLQQYCVNISRQGDTSVEVKQLTGSDQPFVTQEANSEDIFTPVRQQTGTLRVLDDTGGALVDELLPDNNTQKMVTLVNLTTGKTEWIGFMAAEVFTQPWENSMTELEFPLKSAIACLSDVQIQTGVTGTNRLAMLVYNGFTSMFGEGEVPFTDIVMIDDTYYIFDQLLICANFETFFSKETIKNDNSETVIRVGDSYMDAIKAMCSTFGLTLRQQGTTLYFAHYDQGGNFAININSMPWSMLAYIYNNKTAFPEVQSQGRILTMDLLRLADFRGANNKLSFVQGGRAAIVALSVDNASDTNIISMPKSDIVDGGVRNAIVSADGEYIAGGGGYTNELIYYQRIFFDNKDKVSKLNFQYLARASSATEAFTQREVHVTLTSGSSIDIARTKALQETAFDPMAVLYRSVFYRSGYYSYSQGTVMTGAIPGRYSKGNGLLENCLLLVQDVNTGFDSGTSYAPCYLIKTAENVEVQDCYINIKFDIPVTIFSVVANIERDVVYFPEESVSYKLGTVGAVEYLLNGSSLLNNSFYAMWCRLYIEGTNGHTYYWDENNATWVADVVKNFMIGVDGTSIYSNYGEGMNIDNTGGYLAKVTGTMTGKVVFEILNTTIVGTADRMKIKDPNPDYNDNEVEVFYYPFQKIITGLEVDLVYARSITSVNESDNVYRRTILESGFSEDKQIDLTLGTRNNNTPSPSLLRTYEDSDYVQLVSYTNGSGEKVLERPEMHLLNRMVEHYKTMRRTMEAKIATGIDLFRNRFEYNGRVFFGIDKKHDWERDEQEVKFIEVN